MALVGLDIGYSNLKLAAGEAGAEPQVLIRPAGAGPDERLALAVGEVKGAEAAVGVLVDGTPWAAAVHPERFEGWQRTLHADYPASTAYRALFRAALLLAGTDTIERLVTGLPVAQALDPGARERLRQALAGRHPIAAGRVVEVRSVEVLPQPVGAFVEALWASRDGAMLDRLEEGAVLVVDAGFFSFDWTLIVRGELRREASGSSLEAMSVVLERAATLIARERGGQPHAAALERALRRAETHILLHGERVELSPYLERGARAVAPVALEALLGALRRERVNLDLLLLAGGGARCYADVVRERLPDRALVIAAEPISANARGFFRYAQG